MASKFTVSMSKEVGLTKIGEKLAEIFDVPTGFTLKSVIFSPFNEEVVVTFTDETEETGI
jgi:hypothetical protein